MYFNEEENKEVVETTEQKQEIESTETPQPEVSPQPQETQPQEGTEKQEEATPSQEQEQSKEEVKEVKEEVKKEDGKPSNFIPPEKRPENWDPFAAPERRPNPRFANRRQPENPFESRLLDVKRVIKVTKGGRRFKFSALVVVGNKKGQVGFAIGKSIEVPEAIKKAERLAKKNLYRVSVVGKQATVSHDIIGHHGASKVLLKPAAEGKGIVASNNVRAVVELAGIRNIYSKNLGSNNPLNVVWATIDGLTKMRTKKEVMALRGKKEL